MSTSFIQSKNPAVQIAISLGSDTHNWLINTHSPRILQISNHACNLANERSEVISLVSREIGNGPFNLVISEQASDPLLGQITSYTPISICRPGLRIGEVLIDVRQAILWQAKPDWSGLADQRDQIVSNLRHQMNWLIKEADQESLLSLLSPLVEGTHPGSELHNTHSKTTALRSSRSFSITTWMHRLFKAIHSCDLEVCRKASQHLAGLGLGLTPAGDDFLIGAIYAAWIIHPVERASLISSTIASGAIPRTTTLSAAWIRAASRGQVNESWFDCLTGLKTEARGLIELSLRRLLAIGHTSGADALAGFIGCLTQGMTSRDNKFQSAHPNESELKVTRVAVPLWD